MAERLLRKDARMPRAQDALERPNRLRFAPNRTQGSRILRA